MDGIVGSTRRFFASLRFRLVLFAILIFLPALGLLIYFAVNHRDDEAARAQEDTILLARLAAREEQNLIESGRQALTALSSLSSIRLGNTLQCSVELAVLRQKFPVYANFGVIELDGRVSCSSIPLAAPVNLSDRLYFRKAVETRDFVVGEYLVGRITGKPSLNLGYPVYDLNNQFVRVVFVAIDLAWLQSYAVEANLPEGSSVSALSKDGTILFRYPEPERWNGKSVPDSTLLRALRGAQGETHANGPGVDGIDRIRALVPLSGTLNGQPAFVTIGIPRSIAFAHANDLRNRSIIALVIVSALMFAITRFGSEFLILRPMRAVTSAARKLAAGDSSARVGMVRGVSEFSNMANTFDYMAGELQSRQRQLQEALDNLRAANENLVQRVAERTAKLQEQIALTEEERSTLQSVLDAASDGMTLIAPDGKILAANPALGRIFTGQGLRRDELSVYNIADIREFRARIYAEPERASRLIEDILADSERTFTEVVRQKWPVERDLALFSSPVKAKDGRYLGRLFVYREITK